MDFQFGFNDIVFSNRVLHLEIIPALASNASLDGNKYLNWFSSLHDANNLECGGTDFEVKKLHLNSLILAAKSPFFYKLFKNGMRDSKQRNDFTLRINASEEGALMDLLKFMYGNPMSAKSESDLVDVLMAADKFEVTTCMTHCIELLLKLPMTTKSALFYVELASVVFIGEVTRPLIDAAKQYLCALLSGFTESQQEAAMSLPLCAVEAVLGSDDLEVNSEEVVLDFILKWARLHYPKLEDRRDILTKHLLGFIGFPSMSCSELKKVVECPDFEYEQMSKFVLNALFFNVGLSHVASNNSTQYSNNVLANYSFPRRLYSHRGVIPFDINKQVCTAMVQSSSRICSKEICVGGQCFLLVARRNPNIDKSVDHFALHLEMKGSGSCSVGFEFAAMKKPSNQFRRLFMVNNRTFTSKEKGWGTQDLFGIPWTNLMNDDNDFMIEGIIHIQARVTVNN